MHSRNHTGMEARQCTAGTTQAWRLKQCTAGTEVSISLTLPYLASPLSSPNSTLADLRREYWPP